MIYVYCQRSSAGARALVNAMNEAAPKSARRLRNLDVRKPGLPGNSLVINWGDHGPLPSKMAGDTRVLNCKLVSSKYAELLILADKEIPVPPHSLQRGKAGWLARTARHQEARDLRANLEVGDYYVEYVPTTVEFRIHIVGGASIRAGIKQPRLPEYDKRFRSWEAGWGLLYGRAAKPHMKQAYRDVARKAVAALGYDFGAVDIGITMNGKPIVWEVNSAPGLEGATITAYASKFAALAGGG